MTLRNRMTTIFLVLQFVLAIIVAILVLLQKSSSMGLGAYSGSNESVFGAKGPTGFLTKATFIVGTLFVLNTLVLGYFYNESSRATLMDTVEINSLVPNAPEAPVNTPSAPAAPEATQDNSAVPPAPPVN